MATTALVARRTGEKDPRGAARAGVQAVVIGIAISLLFGFAGAWFAPQLLGWMGASPEIVAKHIAIGPAGVFWAIALVYSRSAVVGVVLFRRGKWKEKEV
jgi:Na+-driven multidrug efflux pump